MSALGQKQTSGDVRLMSALPPKADIRTWPALVQQPRQLGDVRRDPPRLVSRQAECRHNLGPPRDLAARRHSAFKKAGGRACNSIGDDCDCIGELGIGRGGRLSSFGANSQAERPLAVGPRWLCGVSRLLNNLMRSD